MANIKLVATSTTEGLTSTVKAGTQQFYIDEPLSQGGGNMGPDRLCKYHNRKWPQHVKIGG